MPEEPHPGDAGARHRAEPEEGASHADGAHDKGAPVGRRVVLGMLGLGALGIVAGAPVASGLGSLLARDPTGIAAVLPGVGGFRFYSVTAAQPDVAPQDARVRVDGLVRRPLDLSLAGLAALPQTGITADFQCVTGWRVADVPWSGVLLRDVLAAAGPTTEARAVRFESADGVYTESLDLAQASRDDVLVATTLFGQPVAREHGGPVRLYVAPMYGYKSLKWLSRVELVDEVQPGYWEQRGYDVDAWVGSSNGRADAPIA